MNDLTVEEISQVIAWYDAEINRLKTITDKHYWGFTRSKRGAPPVQPEYAEKHKREAERRILWAIRRGLQ